mmetsp:Transcript_41948/g.82048  ORF Transcript_41948/g.82048 Transcript_41948/m.82048 type:complete len:218 (-) Transcript_41948:2063-2716(-)
MQRSRLQPPPRRQRQATRDPGHLSPPRPRDQIHDGLRGRAQRRQHQSARGRQMGPDLVHNAGRPQHRQRLGLSHRQLTHGLGQHHDRRLPRGGAPGRIRHETHVLPRRRRASRRKSSRRRPPRSALRRHLHSRRYFVDRSRSTDPSPLQAVFLPGEPERTHGQRLVQGNHNGDLSQRRRPRARRNDHLRRRRRRGRSSPAGHRVQHVQEGYRRCRRT